MGQPVFRFFTGFHHGDFNQPVAIFQLSKRNPHGVFRAKWAEGFDFTGVRSSHYTQVASHRKMQAFLTDERRHELGS